MDETPWKPTRAQLEAARNKTIPDLIAEDLDVLFCGINPGLYSAAVSHHFVLARAIASGRRCIWPAFTDQLLSPFAERCLLEGRCGITNLVARATAAAAELAAEEFVAGGKQLRRKLRRYRPRLIAILGVTAYRTAFDQPRAMLGLQNSLLEGSIVWVLPSPSGLNAHYQLAGLAHIFAEMRATLKPTT